MRKKIGGEELQTDKVKRQTDRQTEKRERERQTEREREESE